MHRHQFVKAQFPGYERCIGCGTYHSTELAPPDELYKNNYWNGETRSLLKDQVINLTTTEFGISKIDKILSYVDGGSLLEIGCAPGILLREAAKRCTKLHGIEPDRLNIPFIKQVAGSEVEIIEGYFPECKTPINRDNIIAMDVVEHIENFERFILIVKLCLSSAGKFIFMSPIILEDKLFRVKDFLPIEHAWIFTKKYLQNYLSEEFSSVIFDRWRVGHEIVICQK